MEKICKLSVLFVLLFSVAGFSQNKVVSGAPCQSNNNQKAGPAAVQNGTGTIATSYTVSACGLNFTQASVRLNQRSFSFNPPTGVPQPATYSISGIPPCATIVKAFLYTELSGNGVPVTATITNPFSGTAGFPMTIIGAHMDKCWGYAGTYSYRADVTAIIIGNGTYTISGIPASPVAGTNDADGATLIVIYRDLTQNYTGSIVIADGCLVGTGTAYTATIGGFNVCNTPTLTSNFMLIGDQQQLANSPLLMNSNTSNYTSFTTSQNVWDFVQAPGNPAMAGQTSAVYGNYNTSDCTVLVMAGMYFRTSCLSCTSPGFNVTAVATGSCGAGTASATPSGGVGPYTYTWSPAGGNASSVSGMPSGIYTVTVRDASCAIGTATVSISTTPTVSVNNATMCSGSGPVTLLASGASTYSWNTGATTPQIVVSPGITTVYTVTGYSSSCSDTKTVSVTVNTSPTVNIAASNSVICSGQTVTLTASGASTYSWSTGAASPQIVISPTISSNTYFVTGYNAGCSNTQSVSVTVMSSPTVNVTANTTTLCSGGSATLAASGASTYSWNTGATSPAIVVSPSVNTTYTVTGSNGSCTNTKTINIGVGTTPVISGSTSNSLICAGQTVTLSASGASSYTFNPGGITGNPIALSPTVSTTYTVLGTNGGPCVGMATILQSVSACTGIDKNQFKKIDFGVYPNPNSGEFAVIVPEGENAELEIYNAIGQKVVKKILTEEITRVNLTEQPEGIYYVRVTRSDKTKFSARIIKE